MSKILFTDGITGVREVHSAEQLEKLVSAAPSKESIKIWQYHSSEWINYSKWCQGGNISKLPGNKIEVQVRSNASTLNADLPPRHSSGKAIARKFLYFTGAAVITFLVVNFTRIEWKKATGLTSFAARPANVPVMDVDSLVNEIESVRGQAIDRYTKFNLSLRNTWPDRISLEVTADRETNGKEYKHSNILIGIDNSTGASIDQAIARIQLWQSGKISKTDTFYFKGIPSHGKVDRAVSDLYKGDSLSVSFESIKAKSFNFCYSAATKNSSGNYNDRWFCRN